MKLLLKQKLDKVFFYQVNNEYTWKMLNSQKYIWNEQRNMYYKVGEIGALIWEYCQYPISEQQIVELLMEEYEVPQEECQRQVEHFLVELLADNLVIKVDNKDA